MALTVEQNVQVRRYLGLSPLGVSYDSAAESAIRAIDAVSDQGATQDHVVGLLTELGVTETQIKTLRTRVEAAELTGELRVDASRGIMVLRSEGRRLVNQLADVFSMRPYRDVFSPGFS